MGNIISYYVQYILLLPFSILVMEHKHDVPVQYLFCILFPPTDCVPRCIFSSLISFYIHRSAIIGVMR